MKVIIHNFNKDYILGARAADSFLNKSDEKWMEYEYEDGTHVQCWRNKKSIGVWIMDRKWRSK